ncbi:MAG: aspartate--tRNA ligase [Candidatus Omnitrophica bacterium]|nr:aspartate--tRNA ligase [Candidatus Omnitrophota bacterium]MBU2044739.1 aspartate--tRNA ligase [Candidatus Omnitrophota bacterium]MBU2250877.1 aspartate--tRNA ligase [Candidatus Omnitrophota bacterium]MBU2473882.1 aspartate--tRNA ligase [Candidatus Omnitrophota bacterium]
MLRTHTCGELAKEDVNKEAVLCGWVAARRDHGKIIFVDLRDRYGITQIVFLPKPDKETYEKAKKIRNEDVLKIKGAVGLRPKNTENPNIATGLVEVCAKDLEVISSACDLPFSVDDSTEASEEVRFTHRYLDLRRDKIRNNFILRHKLNQEFRNFLNQEGFLEIETPFLTKSTPEGARDYLVPSRLSPNKFYALPQSPQLFKQILMVGGMDKYYQIARCFRDEDLRKDRQPEFTQLDMEMSFIDQEDIISLIERMMAGVFSKALGVEIKTPFERISHKQAIEKYNSDKPDIGSGQYRFAWVLDFPLFEFNPEEKSWQMCHHPFTSPHPEDMQFLDSDLSKVRAKAYDLVLNGQELGSGSIRIHDIGLQQKIFSILGISETEAETKFGFLLRAFKHGAPVHGGIAFGLDRLYAIISGSESIREVIAFPKTQRGVCPLSDAPSYVSEKQLKELNLKLSEPEQTGK